MPGDYFQQQQKRTNFKLPRCAGPSASWATHHTRNRGGTWVDPNPDRRINLGKIVPESRLEALRASVSISRIKNKHGGPSPKESSCSSQAPDLIDFHLLEQKAKYLFTTSHTCTSTTLLHLWFSLWCHSSVLGRHQPRGTFRADTSSRRGASRY